MSAPSYAHSVTWIGLRTLAQMISVSISPAASKISLMLQLSLLLSVEISSSLPKNGDTYVAPALAAIMPGLD